MQVHISGVHFDLSDPIRSYTAEKAGKLGRIFDGITEIEILLKGDKRKFHCEMILHISNKPDIVIDVADDNMYAAVDLAVDKGQRQLRRLKEKLRGHRSLSNAAGRAPEREDREGKGEGAGAEEEDWEEDDAGAEESGG
ncbi:MAG: ribosome-associated translation inhibitor RaiA [Planctomycetota bacterium]